MQGRHRPYLQHLCSPNQAKRNLRRRTDTQLYLWHWFAGLLCFWNMTTPTKQQTNKTKPLSILSQKSIALWIVQMLETFRHYLRTKLVLSLLKWLKISLCGDLERHLRCMEQVALWFAKEMGVQLFTVIICGLGSLWAIKPHLFLTRSMGIFLLSLTTLK